MHDDAPDAGGDGDGPVPGMTGGGSSGRSFWSSSSTPLAFGNALTNVSLNTLVSLAADEDEQGGAFGLTQSASSLARTFGPALAGLLYVAVAYWSPFVVSGLLFVPVLAVLGVVARERLATLRDSSSAPRNGS